MRTIFKLTVGAPFVLGAFAVQAQQNGNGGGRFGDPAQRAEQQTATMTQELSLSQAQSDKVKEINVKYGNKMKEAREASAGDREAMRETMSKLRQEQDTELQSVLTKEQWAKWTTFREEQRNKWNSERGTGGVKPTPPPTDGSDKKKKSKNKSKNKDEGSNSDQ